MHHEDVLQENGGVSRASMDVVACSQVFRSLDTGLSRSILMIERKEILSHVGPVLTWFVVAHSRTIT